MRKKSIPEKSYHNISLDQLVTYCVYVLQEEKKEATFEDIVAICFEFFPEKFSLTGYPEWPDSSRVNKTWLRCRTDFKYIKGSVKNGFKVTAKGLEVVERVQAKLQRPVSERLIVKERRTTERTREEQFINKLEKSKIFQRYMEEPEEADISHYEFCDMLYCTLESSAESLRENLNTLKEYAEKLKKVDAMNFLMFAEKKHIHILNVNTGTNRKFKGGMNKKKGRGGKK